MKFDIIAGNTSLDELMTHLVQVVEVFKEQQLAEIREEEERMAREQMLAEQDAAYQESLAADRAKVICCWRLAPTGFLMWSNLFPGWGP